ncbi:MAG: T9SS type A sorting domain-containing protein [Saprospiraceae bacterium]
MRTVIFILLLSSSFPSLKAQPGCTDPQAINFDPLAVENDGSCSYPATSYNPVFIAELPADLSECSGLAWFADRLWTHQDGGNEDLLYVIDTLTGAKLQTVTLPNTDNIDWEDLAENDEYLFVGDFGNNNGNRTDLRIFRIKKSGLLAGTSTPEIIAFSYSDQTDFSSAPNANNYDCEAFFFWNDSLHLFSKNWLNFNTRHYVLPAEPGNQIAQLRDSLNVQGLVTGADITDDGKAVLLGYSFGNTFLWLLWDFEGGDVFSGNKRRITMGNPLFVSQVEGIVYRNNHYGYICAERFASQVPQRLYNFDIEQWTSGVSAVLEIEKETFIKVFPNPVDRYIEIEFLINIDLPIVLKLVDSNGKIVICKQFSHASKEEIIRIDLEKEYLGPGLFQLVLTTSSGIVSKKLIKR